VKVSEEEVTFGQVKATAEREKKNSLDGQAKSQTVLNNFLRAWFPSSRFT
jgi:hypothetical protein